MEVREREGGGAGAGSSPTKDAVQFKLMKNVEREKLEQQRQMDQDFPGGWIIET